MNELELMKQVMANANMRYNLLVSDVDTRMVVQGKREGQQFAGAMELIFSPEGQLRYAYGWNDEIPFFENWRERWRWIFWGAKTRRPW